MNDSKVIAVSCSPTHTFSKPTQSMIKLVAGIGVEGDAHSGKLVKHRFLVKKDPTKPNIRQVHLMHAELFDELSEQGFSVGPGDLGENITTRGVDLLALPTGTNLRLGENVLIELTALRNPCVQIDDFQKGVLKAVLDKDEERNLVRKAGVMGIVLVGGDVQPGDSIVITLPPQPFQALEYVW